MVKITRYGLKCIIFIVGGTFVAFSNRLLKNGRCLIIVSIS